MPYDGEVFYYGVFLSPEQQTELFGALRETIQWQQECVTLFGKTHHLTRQVAWFHHEQQPYHYANSIKLAQPNNQVIARIQHQVESLTGQTYNSCLANFYPDGTSGMGWHSDNEPVFAKAHSIASVSLGAQRSFQLKHKASEEKFTVELASGSLLEMAGETQQHWLHALPKRKRIHEPRINLTFRQFLTKPDKC